MKIGVIDYGCGNVGSIVNMVKKAKAEPILIRHGDEFSGQDKFILPGVGAFDPAVEKLKALQLWDGLNEVVLKQRRPILGICLGMQLLSRGSEEGCLPGLGWLDAQFRKFRFEPQLRFRVPHMGWNSIQIVRPHPILSGLPQCRFYFVHSFKAECNDPSDIVATTTYGHPFVSVYARDHIVGVQFHPEKSHAFGLNLLTSFIWKA